MIAVKRVYDLPRDDDGYRVLVDRIWPRGLSKEDARLDAWVKSVAPSTELRQWFKHDPDKWPEFQRRYCEELDHNPEPVEHIRQHASQGKTTLLFGARNEEMNNAVALKAYIESHQPPRLSV